MSHEAIICPYCNTKVGVSWSVWKDWKHAQPRSSKNEENTLLGATIKVCRCLECYGVIIKYECATSDYGYDGMPHFQFIQIYPSTRTVIVPEHIPENIAKTYKEAVAIADISPNGSAVLSRRCLQVILKDASYDHFKLSKQVEKALEDNKLPPLIARSLDAVRNIGNMAAHQHNDLETNIVIEVTPEDAKFLLEILRNLLEWHYVQPAENEQRIASLDGKLKAAGKQPNIKPKQ